MSYDVHTNFGTIRNGDDDYSWEESRSRTLIHSYAHIARNLSAATQRIHSFRNGGLMVFRNVVLQVIPSTETCVTLRTLVGFHRRMDPHVFFQIITRPRSVRANYARERLSGRVGFHVFLQISLLSERSFTAVAFELFRIVMNFHVSFQIARCPKCEPAYIAFVVAFARVYR